MPNEKDTKQIVKIFYGAIAKGSGCGCSCGCGNDAKEEISKQIGYSSEEINAVPEANLGLGCGNPVALGQIKAGDVILDLGSGAGFDCFLAAKKTGESGKVIGVDMTESMIFKARSNAEKYGYKNVEFRLGDIENLPIDDNSIILSSASHFEVLLPRFQTKTADIFFRCGRVRCLKNLKRFVKQFIH